MKQAQEVEAAKTDKVGGTKEASYMRSNTHPPTRHLQQQLYEQHQVQGVGGVAAGSGSRHKRNMGAKGGPKLSSFRR